MLVPAISIEALMVLDAIDTRGSYASAAEQLNKVPSALSYIVQKLEEQLDVTLFQRQGRKSVLTPAGKHLLVEGRKFLDAINKLSEQTQTIAKGWEPKIRIAVDSILTISPILTILKSFLDEHPNIEIDIREEVLNGTWEALINDQVDLLIGAAGPVPPQKGIRAVKIDELRPILVVNPNHPLAQKSEAAALASLNQYRAVVVHDSAEHEIPWSTNIIENSERFYVTSVEHKLQAIVAGIGFGYLPLNRVQPYLENGTLVVVSKENNENIKELYLAWKLVNQGKGLANLRKAIEKYLHN